MCVPNEHITYVMTKTTRKLFGADVVQMNSVRSKAKMSFTQILVNSLEGMGILGRTLKCERDPHPQVLKWSDMFAVVQTNRRAMVTIHNEICLISIMTDYSTEPSTYETLEKAEPFQPSRIA